MAFLDFFEALIGCAEVYVVEASEQPAVTVMVTRGEQQAEVTPEPTAASSMAHSPSAVEQVSHIHAVRYVFILQRRLQC